jgi:hypothetical protein
MASTCCRPIIDNYCPHNSTIKIGFQFLTPLNPLNAAVFGNTTHFNLSTVEKAALRTDLRSRAPRAVNQLSPAAYTAELPKNGEISDSDDDDDDVLSLRQILASPKQVIEVIHLTSDDDDDGGLTEVSWLRNTQTAQHCVRLTPPSLTDYFQVTDQSPLSPTALSTDITVTYRRRRYNLV